MSDKTNAPQPLFKTSNLTCSSTESRCRSFIYLFALFGLLHLKLYKRLMTRARELNFKSITKAFSKKIQNIYIKHLNLFVLVLIHLKSWVCIVRILSLDIKHDLLRPQSKINYRIINKKIQRIVKWIYVFRRFT